MFADSAIFVNLKNGDRQVSNKEDLSYFLEDFDLTESDVQVLPISEATAKELAQVIGEEMENANYHSMVTIASELLEQLDSSEFTEGQLTQVMRALSSVLGRVL